MEKHSREGAPGDYVGFSKEAAEALYRLAEAAVMLVMALFGLFLRPDVGVTQGELFSSYDWRGPDRIFTVPFIVGLLSSLAAMGNRFDMRIFLDEVNTLAEINITCPVSVQVHGIDFLSKLPGAMVAYTNLVVSAGH